MNDAFMSYFHIDHFLIDRGRIYKGECGIINIYFHFFAILFVKRLRKGEFMLSNAQIIALGIFIFVYALIITSIREKTIAGVFGLVLLGAFSILTVEEMIAYVDWEAIMLLFGLMVIVGAFREAGVFAYLTAYIINFTKCDPRKMHYMFIGLTAVLASLLDSVTVALFMVTVTIMICEVIEVNPKPYIVSEIIAANVGGTATAIGNPPSIMIASAADLTFIEFAANMAPITILCLILLTLFLRWYYKDAIEEAKVKMERCPVPPRDLVTDEKLFKLCIIVFLVFVVLMISHSFIHISPAIIALGCSGVLLFLGGKKMPRILHKVEWPTLLFFGSLFVVVGGLAKVGILYMIATGIAGLIGQNMIAGIFLVAWTSALGSAAVDNIPLVATLLPIVFDISQITGLELKPLLWAMALGACMGGNATIVASAAGIVAQSASEKAKYPITFFEFLKVGMLSVLLTVGVGSVYLAIRFGVFG